MHKDPIKFRYIVASNKYVIKSIAKKLTRILQLVLYVNRKYCQKILLYTGINRMWVADNSNNLLHKIESINKKSTARNIATFDFSTLYTKLPLQDLIDKLKQVTEIAFNQGRYKPIYQHRK
jgi:hypothetical protein